MKQGSTVAKRFANAGLRAYCKARAHYSNPCNFLSPCLHDRHLGEALLLALVEPPVQTCTFSCPHNRLRRSCSAAASRATFTSG